MSSKAVTRMQASLLIVVIVAAVAGGAYFATSRSPESTTGQSIVPNPDTISVETIGQPDTLDPAIDYETSGNAIIQNVYEQLLFFKGEHADQVVPWLAESYDVSADGLTYTFHLRSGITFTDGTPLDAKAVYFSLMRPIIMDDPNGPAWAMSQVIRGGQNYSKSYNNAGPSSPNGYGDAYTQGELNDLLNAKPVEIVDPMTVAIHLEHPYAGWPFIMAFSVTAIVSPSAITQHWTAPTDGTPYIEGATAGDYHNQLNPWPLSNMVGTGPYILQSWDQATQTLVLVRNENYWGGPNHRGVAPVKNVIIKGIDDVNTRVLNLKAGKADISLIPATGGVAFQFIDKDSWFSSGTLKPVSSDYQAFPQCPPSEPIQGKCLWPAFITNMIAFNQKILGPDRKPSAFQPFQDVRIRKAFTLAFNRTAYIHDVLQDFAIPANQILPPGMFGYDPTIQPTPYDPAQVKTLLLDAGKNPLIPSNAFSPANPKTVEITYNLGNIGRETASILIANTINNLSSETGLFATATGMAWPQFLAHWRSHQASLFFIGWLVDYVDPDDFLVPFAHGTAGTFATRVSYNNPDVTRLVEQQASMTDRTQRLQVISQIEHMVNDDWAFVWLNYGALFQISRSWIHERDNASVAGGVSALNQGITGFWFFDLEKGSTSSSPLTLVPQLPALGSSNLRKSIEGAPSPWAPSYLFF